MISPEARERLARLMDERRLELGLRWRDVAEAGGVSYEVLRDVRNGSGGIRRLTEHGIEAGLQWEAGSVRRILEGGEPSVPAARGADYRLPATAAMEAAMRTHLEEVQLRVELAKRRNPGKPLTGRLVFPLDARDAGSWDDLLARGWSENDVPRGIAALHAWEQEAAGLDEDGFAAG